jgi:hypothetical protein
MTKLNIVAASRQRPVRMYNVVKKWLDNAVNPEFIRAIVSIDSDDPMSDQYFNLLNPLSTEYNTKVSVIINPNTCTVEAINSIKPHIDGELILVFSDDTDCFESWDKQLLDFSSELSGKYVIKTSDGIGKDLITMPIFSKDYLDCFPYIYHPSYKHMFCDTELTCVASMLGCVINGEHFEFQHLHYSRSHHDKDSIDDKNQSTFYEGMEIFKRRLENNFDLSPKEVKGKIPKQIIEWIARK